jgi:uncharacterized protein (DUF885 family)
MRFWLMAALLAAGTIMTDGCKRRSESMGASSGEFKQFVDDYFDRYFEWRPSAGTDAGFHQYDSRLENYSADVIQARIAAVKQQVARLEALRRESLTPDEQIDAEMLDGQLRAELLDLESLRRLHTNPMAYVSLPGSAIDSLMKRNFAPSRERLKSVIARLKAVPLLLDQMRANVQAPPVEFTDLALRIASGSVSFFDDTVRKWGEEAAGGDAALARELDDAAQAASRAMDRAAAWLKRDLLPRSKGSYAIGAEYFSAKLLYEEMLDIPIDRLLEIGEANLEKDHRAFLDTAQRIAPGKPPMEVMRMISQEHPPEAQLVDTTRRTVESVRQFLVDHRIVAIPSEVRPIVAETPPYARAGAFAMMESPGPYETKATEAYYYVTPPERDWAAKQKEEHLRLFNRPVLNLITIHEAWPGHYLQFLYSSQFPTKTRKLISCASNVEGWAHYSEQMMLEQGFGNGDLKIKLAQLSEALLRDCRYVVGIRLHTRGMTVEEGTRIFMERGFAERAVAFEEARRGAYDPTYLYYTLGKLLIYKLRDDYQKAKGPATTLAGFHNEFVRQGGIPIKLVRRILLPGDTAPLL